MQSILIIDSSEVFRNEMVKELQKDYHVYSCALAVEGYRLLNEYTPDGLIVNMMLHGTDGLSFLEHLKEPRPKAILTRSSIYPPYILQRLKDLGVAYPVLTTCSVHSIAHRMRDIMETVGSTMPVDAQEATASHLRRLGVPYWGGYDDLRIGIPIFAQDPGQSMAKEFYSAVAALRGRDNWRQVERAIRKAKEYAYHHRDDAVWREYFSDTSECPKNKRFIARLAEFLE